MPHVNLFFRFLKYKQEKNLYKSEYLKAETACVRFCPAKQPFVYSSPYLA